MRNDLIGKIVQHRQTRKSGRIVDIIDNIIKVSFGDEIYKFSYPGDFETILELEDEELEKDICIESSLASFEQFVFYFSNLIQNEISYLKKNGGTKYRVIDGVRLKGKVGEYLYAFDTDTELHFQNGTQIKIWMQSGIIKANIETCEEYTITIRTNENIGESIRTLEFTAESWMILEALNERLSEIDPIKSSIAYELACKGKTKIDFRKGITKGQDNAFKRAESEPITIIWGPPGTGKTQTLANIALNHIESGRRVLMLSYSNVSVDGALLRVAKMSDMEPGQIIRYGYPREEEVIESDVLSSYKYTLKNNPCLANKYKELNAEKSNYEKKSIERTRINKEISNIREKLVEKERELIHKSAFVATTVSKAIIDRDIFTQKFDVVIFDEASMAYVPQVVFASSLAKSQFICLGDFCQLPAIVQNKENQRLSIDIFEHTGIKSAVENEYGHEWLIMLDIQHRMNIQIADFAGKIMYGNMLKTANDIIESRKMISDCGPLEEEAMGLFDISYMYSVCTKTREDSRINLLSGLIAIRIAELFIDNYEVGIITPYNAQSRLILQMVRDLSERNNKYSKITCATVHQFQGSEKPVIIYDAVDCYRMKYPGKLLTRMENDLANRLFNVALTRTQGKFIMIANINYLKKHRIPKKLMFTKSIDKMYSEKAVLAGEDIIYELSPISDEETEVYIDDRIETWKKYMVDISNAKKTICIDMPGIMDENDEAINELVRILNKLYENRVTVEIRANEGITLQKGLKKYTSEQPYVTTPITIIDKSIVWYGQPLCAADFITEGSTLTTKYFPCIRFVGKKTVRSLEAILD